MEGDNVDKIVHNGVKYSMLVTSKEAAEILGLTIRAVQKMVEVGTLPAQRLGQNYVYDRDEVLKRIDRRGPGRPRKTQEKPQ